ncbi:adenylosuccinate synthase [Candidatus Micrarchaeota archaeon]|nr:adenylosuccinate synthase [Candidatus Micrarchaeota archaeon]
MTSVVIVGGQWGDEGKGKIVDYYASKADTVIRYSGGNNAGHTVVTGKRIFKFHLMPSGAVAGKRVLIGNGVVIDPEVLLGEIEMLQSMGLNPDLGISERAHIILPLHKLSDSAEEKIKGKWKAGTTKRGIGPCYSDKAARFGIRVIDLLNEEVLKEKLDMLFVLKERQITKVFNEPFEITKEEIFKKYTEHAEKLKKYVTDVSVEANSTIDKHKHVLFEGAQGTMLDLDHGLYPFGTSSNVTSGAACTGTGVSPKKIDEIVGVVKAYTSRVGEGPVPTELLDETGEQIRKKGMEFGTTTGRPRRVGWLDMVTVNYACRVNGLTGLAITKLDILGGLNKIKICTAYNYKGKMITEQPADVNVYAHCKPIYEEVPGWKDMSIEEWIALAKKGYDALPKEIKSYTARISEISKTPVYLISVGQDRDATINLKDLFG